MKAGQKIKVISWGIERHGIVDRVKGKIAFVRMADNGVINWYHLESLKRVK